MGRWLALLLGSFSLVACAGEHGGHVSGRPAEPTHEPVVVAPGAPPLPTPAAPPEPPAPPTYVAPAAGVDALHAGAAFSCLLREGQVSCWGSNRFGQLGDADSPRGRGAFSARPVRVAGLDDVRALTLGSFHACAILGDGGVRCWGHGGFGQLGRGDREDGFTAAGVPGLEHVSAISAGERHACAISDGQVLCWGSNDRGQLGRAVGEGSLTPVVVHDLSTASLAVLDAGAPVELGSGRAHSCVRMAQGAIYCWGEDVDGELGRGARDLPAGASPFVAPLTNQASMLALRVGWGHACALTSAHRAWCWGRNDARQLGDGEGGEQGSCSVEGPVAVALEDVVDVAPGGFHSCFLLGSGDVRCVGANHNGQLGDGSQTPRAQPVLVAGLHHVTAIAAGETHSCALTAAGEVRCWGNPHSGRVGPHGDERGSHQPSPVRVTPPQAPTQTP